MPHIPTQELITVIDIVTRSVTLLTALTAAWQAARANQNSKKGVEQAHINHAELKEVRNEVNGRMSEVLQKVPDPERLIGALEDTQRKKEEL